MVSLDELINGEMADICRNEARWAEAEAYLAARRSIECRAEWVDHEQPALGEKLCLIWDTRIALALYRSDPTIDQPVSTKRPVRAQAKFRQEKSGRNRRTKRHWVSGY